jgi:hypothetical protein
LLPNISRSLLPQGSKSSGQISAGFYPCWGSRQPHPAFRTTSKTQVKAGVTNTQLPLPMLSCGCALFRTPPTQS